CPSRFEMHPSRPVEPSSTSSRPEKPSVSAPSSKARSVSQQGETSIRQSNGRKSPLTRELTVPTASSKFYGDILGHYADAWNKLIGKTLHPSNIRTVPLSLSLGTYGLCYNVAE